MPALPELLSKPDDLFNRVLVEPANRYACDELLIVSGYASPVMMARHFSALGEHGLHPKLHLVVGMALQDGMLEQHHRSFCDIVSSNTNIQVSYVTKGAPVHAKVYLWRRKGRPDLCYSGSANYTQQAFGGSYVEGLSECNADHGEALFRLAEARSTLCDHSEATQTIRLTSLSQYNRLRGFMADEDETPVNLQGLETVAVSLLTGRGDVGPRSGLNWGQRPEAGREPNQAYIPLKSEVYRSHFFPERPTQFSVLTDDGQSIICVRAQDNGKAIHTPLNNSLLGEYFRIRLGVPLGQPVRLDDLSRYGRTDVVFVKIDDETYYMDFSKPNP